MTLYVGTDNLQYYKLNARFKELHQRYNQYQYCVLVENSKEGAERLMSAVDKTFGVKGKWR